MALGMVTQLPEEDQTSISRKQMLARLDVCMGVRAFKSLLLLTLLSGRASRPLF